MTKTEFENEMEWFCEFYEKKLSERQARVWFDIVGNAGVKQFHACLMKHIKHDENPFFPPVGKITQLLEKSKGYWQIN